MTAQQKGIITLVKSALTGEIYSIDEDFDLEKAAETAKRHGIETMLYYGAVNCGFDNSSSVMQQLFLKCCSFISVSEGQKYEIGKLIEIFGQNKIDIMPLKGTVLKDVYPKGEMRRMGDADILIRESQYEQVKSLLEECGYSFKYETDHEIVWKKPILNLELHKKLVPERNKEFYAYFGSGWDFSKQSADNEYVYEFSKEHMMIYLFTHLTKHYTSGGIGIQHMTDLWIYSLKNPDLDNIYIVNELKKLCLDKFYTNVMHTLAVWFDSAESDDMSELITDFIFSSGVYGTHSNHILALSAREERYSGKKVGTAKKIIRTLFPSTNALHIAYPVLDRKRFLLPVIWVRRWFEILFFKRSKLSVKVKDIKNSNEENTEIYQQALNFVGLDFNFKE